MMKILETILMNYNSYTEAQFELALKYLHTYVDMPHIIHRDYANKIIKINYITLKKTCPNYLKVKNELVFLYVHPFNHDMVPLYKDNMTWANSLTNETHVITKIQYKLKRDGQIIYVYVIEN